MSGASVIFYVCTITFGLTVHANANNIFTAYRALEAAKSAWRIPCRLYGRSLDCTVLFNSRVELPITKFDPRLFSPTNTNSFPIIRQSPYNAKWNAFNRVPFRGNYPPLRVQTLPKIAPPTYTYYGTSRSAVLGNLAKNGKNVTLNDYGQTPSSTNTPLLTTPPTEINKVATTGLPVKGEHDELLRTSLEPPSKHPDTHILQYFSTSTVYRNKSIPNEISTRDFKPKSSSPLSRNETLLQTFRKTLDQLERKFLLSTFTKLTAISPEDRRENGISFLQSGFFLHLLLVAVSTEMDSNVTREIEECTGLNMSDKDKIDMLRLVVSSLPESSDVFKFRRSSRLVLGGCADASREFEDGAADAMALQLSWLNGSETSAEITKSLNQMVESDSGGALHSTFEEDELSAGVCGVALATLYARARWRAAPTLLNDSRPFRDAAAAPQRYTRLFRINDVVGYAYLHEWDAEAIEISYATPGLTVLMLVPKEPSLRKLVENVARVGLARVQSVMHQMRVAVTLPLYTLRMTLLLPNKLADMGMPSLLSMNETDCHSLKFSHAVQRLMFWAEAGRNAFKDDGIEWDPRPEMEIVVDRPYLFFVRWHNVTLMNGNFVL